MCVCVCVCVCGGGGGWGWGEVRRYGGHLRLTLPPQRVLSIALDFQSDRIVIPYYRLLRLLKSTVLAGNRFSTEYILKFCSYTNYQRKI